MEFKNFVFKAWKVMEFHCRPLKVMENYSFVWFNSLILQVTKLG